jgi:hypothetical protein
MHPARGSKTATEAAPAGAAGVRRESQKRRRRLLRPALSVGLAALLAVLAASTAHVHAAGSPSQHQRAAAGLDSPLAVAAPHRQSRVKAAIGLFTASPATLPAAGGTVHLVAVVQGATTCSFRASTALSRLPDTESCASGSASLSVRVPKNASAAARTFHFQLVVRGRRGSAVAAPVAVLERAARATGAPVITTQPRSVSAVEGSTVTFTAAARGAARVQWQVSTNQGRSWGNISGADSASLSFVAVSGDANDELRAVFTGHGRSSTTAVATLSVSAPSGSAPPAASAAASPASVNSPAPAPDAAPVITEQPTADGITLGNPATFSAQASGVPAPSVQWQDSADGVNWLNIAGATSSSYSFTPALNQSGYQYRAVFTNSLGSVTTNAVLLDVSAETIGPAVLTQPQSATVVAGQQVSFTATANGVPTPTVQWQQSSDGVNWTTIPGATATTYSFTSSDLDSGYLYRAEFSNSAGQADSAAARLTVSVPVAPSVTEEPVSQQVFVGAMVSFYAAATGNPSPTAQWMVSSDGGATWNAVPGATSTSYTFAPTLANSGWEYEAVFNNGYGSATTDPATLTVAVPESAPQITTEPTSQSVVIGANATFTAAASGNPAPIVQWQVSSNDGDTWGNVSGANSPSYTVVDTGSTENGWEFRAVFSNSVGSQATNAVTLTVAGDQSLYNWSGYVATGGGFTSVTGNWTVPAVTCTSTSNQYSSFWIGIDGKGSPSVEQDGTDSDCSDGQPSYYAWYEMFGDSGVADGDSVPLTDHVAAGDAINAQVSVSGSLWTLYLHDATQNWTESIPISWSGAKQLTAEWIAERPELCSNTCTYAALADFGSVTFSGATANGQSLAALNASPFEMTDGSALLALPSGLNGTGNGFTDTWYASN